MGITECSNYGFIDNCVINKLWFYRHTYISENCNCRHINKPIQAISVDS